MAAQNIQATSTALQAEMTVLSEHGTINVDGKSLTVRLVEVKFNGNDDKVARFWAFGDLQLVAESVNALGQGVKNLQKDDFEELIAGLKERNIRPSRDIDEEGNLTIRLYKVDGGLLVSFDDVFNLDLTEKDREGLKLLTENASHLRQAGSGSSSPAIELRPVDS